MADTLVNSIYVVVLLFGLIYACRNGLRPRGGGHLVLIIIIIIIINLFTVGLLVANNS